MTTNNGDPDHEGIEEAIRKGIETKRAEIRTMIPGAILSYDHTEQRADVQPATQFKKRNEETGELESYTPKPIRNCPVQFPSGGGFSITWPLKPGDTVELRFAMYSLDEWLTSGGTDKDPVDPRRFDVSDAVVAPGLRSFADALGSSRRDNSAIVIHSPAGDEIHLGSANPANWVARDDKVVQELKSLKETIDERVTVFNNHTHPYADGTTSSPSTTFEEADPVESVASNTVKTE